jgi:hypothetical protein
MMLSFISSCRNKIVACSVISPAPDSNPSVSAVAEVEKAKAPSKATKRGGGGASTQTLVLGGAQRGDKGVWGGPVSLSELAFEMEMEPPLEREPPRSQASGSLVCNIRRVQDRLPEKNALSVKIDSRI